MHSSRMCTATACSSSHPHTPLLSRNPPRSRHPSWSRHPPPQSRHVPPARSPSSSSLGVGLEIPPGQIPLNFSLGVVLETPWPDLPQLSPWVWAWKPARYAGIPPSSPGDLVQCMLGYHLQCMLGYHPPPPCEQTDTCKNITVCGW